MRKRFLLASLICLFCWMNYPGIARAQLLIEEGKISRSLKPGETLTGKVILNNTSDRELSIKAYWQDFVYTPPFDGGKKFLPAGTMPQTCASWVNFFPQNFTLGPYGKKEIAYTVKFPAKPEGGYYGVLFFEDSTGQKSESTGISVVARLGCLFFLETAGSSRVAKISDLKADQAKISGEIRNTSSIILIPKGIFYIMDNEGAIFDRGEVPAVYLPPDLGTSFSFSISDKVPPGEHTVVLTFDLGNEETLVQEIDFVKKEDSSLEILQARD